MIFEALAVLLLSLQGANMRAYKNVEAVTGEKNILFHSLFLIPTVLRVALLYDQIGLLYLFFAVI